MARPSAGYRVSPVIADGRVVMIRAIPAIHAGAGVFLLSGELVAISIAGAKPGITPGTGSVGSLRQSAVY
jgi:hypothetical protein